MHIRTEILTSINVRLNYIRVARLHVTYKNTKIFLSSHGASLTKYDDVISEPFCVGKGVVKSLWIRQMLSLGNIRS